MAGGRVRLAACSRPSLASANRWQALVGRREEEAIQPSEMLAGEGVVGRSEEMEGQSPKVLTGEGDGRPMEGGCRPPA